jgi:TRAP-type C4-dicarboxylate transport system permease small subunit
MVFTATVVLNIVVMSIGSGIPPMWVTYAPLPLLFLLMGTGAFLFAQPYIARRRSGRRMV